MSRIKDGLETHQAPIYLATVALAALTAWQMPGTAVLEVAINPALALMLYVTFLQVPLVDLGRALVSGRFLVVVLVANFVAVPLLVGVMAGFMPDDALLRFGIVLVLLAPCIDYVVTFAHMGRADARLLLAATPSLLVVQMLLLPLYLGLFLGRDAHQMVLPGPFVSAFIWLMAVPLLLAGATQWWASRQRAGVRLLSVLGHLPVPATALVLFTVVAAVVPQLGLALDAAVSAAPFYVAFAVLAPCIGWGIARVGRLDAPAGRAVAFSTGTRNSLVVLPLALAVPGAMPVLPAVIVTQTLVELLSELVYVRWIAGWGSASLRNPPPASTQP